jgi:hypothetical protein
MRTKRLFVILLVAAFLVTLTTPLCYAATLSKPNVILPSGWELADETAYPNAISEHDEQGAGVVEYQDSETYDFVMIFYENAPSSNYTDAQLKNEAEDIFYRDHEDLALYDSGVETFAGVKTGYAKTYDSEYDVYHLELVMIKDNYYMNIYAAYDASSTEAENKVEALINSINTDTGLGSMLFIIIGIVVVIIVVVVVVWLLMNRKKKTAYSQAPTYQSNMPVPPPPI